MDDQPPAPLNTDASASSSSTPTDEQHDWVTQFCGINTRASNQSPDPNAGNQNQSVDPSANNSNQPTNLNPSNPSQPGSTSQIEKDFKLPIPGIPKKTIKAWGNRIEIEFQPTITIGGHASIEQTDATEIDAGKLEAALKKVTTDWDASSVTPAVSNGNVWRDLKLGRDGTSYAASTTTDTPLGTLTLKVTFIGIGGKLQGDGGARGAVTVGKAEAALVAREAHLPDAEIDGLKLTKLVVDVGGTVSIAPAWLDIIAKWAGEEIAKQVGKTVVKDTALSAGEAAAAAITADAVIMGALIVGGVGTIFASVYSIVQAWGIGDLAQSYKPSLDDARSGFRCAMAGQAAPTSQYGKAGYDAGMKNCQALIEQTRKANPTATDDVIKEAIARKADDALAQASDSIDRGVRVGLWDGYLAQHMTMLISSDAKWAFVACFGDFPKDSDPEWKKYLTQHPTASKF